MNTIIDLYNKLLVYNKNNISFIIDNTNIIWFRLADITNILETRQGYKLSLRKERIDDFIMKKREKALEKNDDRSKFEINLDNLILPTDVLNKTFNSFVTNITYF